jgi:hypothetical protein
LEKTKLARARHKFDSSPRRWHASILSFFCLSKNQLQKNFSEKRETFLTQRPSHWLRKPTLPPSLLLSLLPWLAAAAAFLKIEVKKGEERNLVEKPLEHD